MNSVYGCGQPIQRTNEQNLSVAMTIAQLEVSLSPLKQQVGGGGILLNQDPITTSPFAVKTSDIGPDLPHTQISSEVDRGPVGQ